LTADVVDRQLIMTFVSLISRISSVSHEETCRRLIEGIERRGLKLFATFDHAGAAREAGLELDPELVIVFGNPRAGTQLMADDPTVGLELPLRILVYERGGEVTVVYHDPHELGGREQVLDGMGALLSELVVEAT
jgi:uncharacterized protein (DUF302 family)